MNRLLLLIALLYLLTLPPIPHPLGQFIRFFDRCSPEAAQLIRTYTRGYNFADVDSSTIRGDGMIILSLRLPTLAAVTLQGMDALIALTIAHEAYHLRELSQRIPFNERATYEFEYRIFQQCREFILDPIDRDNIEKYLLAILSTF